METATAKSFRDNMKKYVESSKKNHEPLIVTNSGKKSFVVLSAEDWESYLETLYVLENKSLMKQLADSSSKKKKITKKEMDEILSL